MTQHLVKKPSVDTELRRVQMRQGLLGTGLDPKMLAFVLPLPAKLVRAEGVRMHHFQGV